MREEKIALDFDGVLADTHTATLELYNRENDADLSLDDIVEWEFDGVDLTIPEWIELSHEAWVLWSHGYAKVNPWQYKIDEIVEDLSGDYIVDIVTHRDPQDQQHVYNWLEDHDITSHYRNLIFVQEYGKEKHEYDYDIYIDDNPHLHHKVPLQYIPTRPWNENIEDGDNLRRFNSLHGIVEDII